MKKTNTRKLSIVETTSVTYRPESATERFIYTVMTRYTIAREETETFASKVLEDPVHALSWSGNAFQAAATMRVCSLVIRRMWEATARGEELPVSAFYETAHRELLRAASSASRSTTRSSTATA